MSQLVQFEGLTHEFPDDFTDRDIQKALALSHPNPTIVHPQGGGGTPPGPHAPNPSDVIKPFDTTNLADRYLDPSELGPKRPSEITAEGKPLPYNDLALNALGAIAGAQGFAGKTAEMYPSIVKGTALPGEASLRNIQAKSVSTRIARSLRPTPSDSGFTDRIDQTLSQVAKANGGQIPRTVEEGIPMAQRAITTGNAALEPYFVRAEAAGVAPSGDPILAATHKAISESMTPSEVQAKGQSLMDRAQMDYGRNFTPRELKQRLELLNSRLSGYYDQSIAKQIASLSDVPDAVIKAQRDATADLLYHTLAPEEGGAGPRTIQKHIGDMIDLKGALERAKNRSIGEAPASVWEAFKRTIPNPIGAASRQALRNNPTTATTEAFYGRTNVDLKKAFKSAVKNTEPIAWPQPASPDYQFYADPAPTTAKQLPVGKAPFSQGTVVPDIAGSPKGPGAPETRIERMLPAGNPQQGQGVIIVPPAGSSRVFPRQNKLEYNPTHQVPFEPRVAAPPADTSSVRAVPGQSQVPQADPSVIPPSQTGKIIDMATRPPVRGKGPDAEWWAAQPPTRPEIQQRYNELFNKAEDLSPMKPVDVPETGIPEGVQRGQDSRQNIAPKVLKGRSWQEASPTERNVIDQLVNEGYGSADIPQFAKGGIITKPTVGLIGEAGPELRVPLSSAHPTVPEKDGTIQAQLNQLLTGKRRVVMIPYGTDMPKRPKGTKHYIDANRNNYIFNPSLISHREIDQAASSNNLPSILGAKDGGMGAPDKSQLGPDARAVVGETNKGEEIQATATDSPHLQKTIEQTKKVTPRDGKIAIKSVGDQLREREDLGSVSAPDKALDKIRGSINVPLDSMGEKEADDLGRDFASKGGVHRIISSPLLRAKQTAVGIAKYNPQAKISTTPNLRPWPLGELEGSPTEQALPELKRLALQAPAEVPRGIGQGSTEGGQSFQRFQRRVLSEVKRQYEEHDRTAPNEVWDLGAHKSIINLIHSWSKAGAKPDFSIDKRQFFLQGTDPASVYHIKDGGRTVQEVNMKGKGRLAPGLYVSRHGSTSFNAPSSAAKPGKSVS